MFTFVAGLRHRPEPGWGWIVFSAVTSLLLGGLILAEWPLSGVWAVGILAGVRLIIAGWALVAVGAVARAASRNSRDERGSEA